MSEDPRRRIEAFIQAAARLARTAPSGRILLARLAPLLDPAWLPGPAREQVRARLDAARTAATEPLELGTVEEVLRRAWDAPAADLLDELEPQPAAVTPTAQVHRAAVDGAPVAVKVLRPGLSAAVRQDLVVFEGLLAPLAAALPRLDGPAILRELRERILDELDLEHEAGLQRRVSRALRNHPVLSIPAPVMRLSHEQVLVTEWVDGVPLSRVTDQAQLDLAAGRVAAFVLGGVRAGIVHGGIDPDDVLLRADGRLAVLDFGAACSVEPRRADAALAMVESFARGDGAALGEAVAALGLLDPEHGPAALELARAVLGELGGEMPSRLDGAALLAAGERLSARGGAGVRLLPAANLPADQLWPLRGIAQAIATIARVGATAPWRELALRSLRGGWDAVE
jgi:serine/threonine protein kinase